MAEPGAVPPIDEMVDGRGGVRPHWRALLGMLGGMGEGVLGERARRLDRAFEDEGMAGVLPGSKREVAWRCDPLPLVLPASEFAALEAGIAQRATLLEALLADLYGPQRLLTEGAIPPEVVFANPAFLRPCRHEGAAPPQPMLHLYAVDLLRGPDGAWRVLADRTTAPAGPGLARENRRLLARVMPEAFRGAPVRSMRPFFDVWQDALQRLAPPERGAPAVALLTRGTHHPRWFEDMLLSRELSCALVECGDLTVRAGVLYLKTLQGLQRVDVLLSRIEGATLDPLESTEAGTSGVPGLLDAARQGEVRILNAPGAGLAEAPALAGFLDALAPRLLGQALLLPSVETLWLGDAAARARLAQEKGWLVRGATDGAAPAPVPLDAWAHAIGAEARPTAYAATRLPVASVVPCVVGDMLEPRPLMLRMFAVFDGTAWRVMPGGLARIGEAASIGGALPTQGLSKDVWVLADEGADIIGPAALQLPPLPIRRQPGALPSRVADNLFWLGRYTERLERAARLVRATQARISRGVVLPREQAEVAALAHCLAQAGFTGADEVAGSSAAQALPGIIAAALRDDGALTVLAERIATLTAMVRDRLTADMHATFTLTLRSARAEMRDAGDGLEAIGRAMISVLRFATAVAGVAAESMVRGGAWLFLDLGRRVERAQAIASEVQFALDQPPARIEGGLRLMLELCDSVITYRSRYLTILQPAPALDLVLADPSNPRALAFQLEAISRSLSEVASDDDRALPDEAASLLAEAEAIVADVIRAPDQAIAAAALPPRLEAMANRIAALSDAVTRRYFALLPAAQTVGLEGAEPALRGGGVIYRLRHVTTYAYAHPVDLAAHLLLLTPRRLAHQQVTRAMLDVTPTPSHVTEAADHFGNLATRVFIDVPHARFEVVAQALVEVRFPDPPEPATTLPWEVVRDIARGSAAMEFTFGSPLAPLVPAARGYAAASFPARRPVLVGLLELMARIRRDFTYKPGVTGPNTQVAEVLENRVGVCQDYAHVMVSGLRGLGLPARYVSGYVRTRPPPGRAARRGADQSHAWAEAWLGPEQGWVGLDPTNDIVVKDEHVVLAWGRDFGDVSPLRGVILGGGEHGLWVGVDLEEVEGPVPA